MLALLGWFLAAGAARGATNVAEVAGWLRSGKYAEVLRVASKAGVGEATGEPGDEAWPRFQIEVLRITGRPAEAALAASNAVVRHPRSLVLRWEASEAFRENGEPARAEMLLEEIRRMASGGRTGARDPAGLVAVGKVALASGVDPKTVLTGIFQAAEKADPRLRDTFLARGELALEKSDFDLAARAFSSGLDVHPGDPDLLRGLAAALMGSDRPRAMEALEAALKTNPRHVPSLLTLVDHSIDAEAYGQAETLLKEVDGVNPRHPSAWAYRAVLAHLRNDPAAEAQARATALATWTNNPAVDHLIGRKLSEKYRFAEGAAHQRQALAFDPDHLPSKLQLAQDLLRLGEEEGWGLAHEVHRRDAYGTTAYNLVTLSDTMSRFVTRTNRHFVVRMEPREADVYGDRVLALLERAHGRLVGKYGATLQEPTVVEIFGSQKDFGVRTFGMPDNPGYLGVCFGRVVTANSPAANKGHPVNWEAVLWHEFCHVVTLQRTANRMPRWLSEGISVYEELQEDGTWGQSMTPRYRSLIVGGELTPVGRLSGAFLSPKTPFHLQFAYFEAALVVEFMVRDFGADAVRSVLADLAAGRQVEEAIGARMAPMPDFESRFAGFARARADGLAPGLAWDKPTASGEPGAKGDAERPSPDRLREWAGRNPTNYWALHEQARSLMEAKRWREAVEPLARLTREFPGEAGPEGGWARLAAVQRALGDVDAEYEALTRWVAVDDEAPQACERLLELASARGEWSVVARLADRYLSLNPLVGLPYENLARAREALQEAPAAVAALQTLLKLDPPNPADIHFRLARLLADTDAASARRHVLQALEDAPRHREALRLLARLPASTPAPNPASTGP